MPPIPPPKPCFLDTQIKLKRRGNARWVSPSGERLWEWDWLHGHIEGYNRRGMHVGVFDAVTGKRIKNAIKGRKIDV
ncbi:colicin E3/pyocin S6 family cytotoxin [Nocardioides sp. WG-D5]|uniref:colicin E3/pyocin S6 family cytotoxin n=1 Tax=Nocardioides sp. YR527 TaxID=1881028 RepID=UPI000B881ED0